MKKIAFVLLSASVLSACMVGPDFQLPAAPPTKAYTAARDSDAKAGPAIALGSSMPAAWWTDLGSPDLDGVVRDAFAHSPDLASAEATLAATRETVNATAGGLLPQVSLGGTAGRQKYGVSLFGPSDFNIPPFTYYEIGPSLSYALDYVGGLRRGVERDQALAAVQGYQRDAAYLSLTGNIAAQAVAMAGARAEIAVSNEIIQEDERDVKLVQQMFQAGTGTRTDTLSAQSQLAGDRALLPGSNQALDVSRHAIAVLAGHAPADWAPPEFSLRDFKVPATLPVSLPSELVHQRPDILAAEARLHAASAQIGVATAQLYPQITLTANATQQGLNPAALFKGSSGAFALAGGFMAPIFNGGTLRAERRAAIDRYNAALADYQKIVLQAFGQVADTLQAIGNDSQQVTVQEQALKTATDSLNLTRQSYAAGNIGIIQVLDAERLRSQAQLGLTRAQAQVLSDVVQLYLATGGGVENAGR